MTKSYFRKILFLYALTWVFLGAIGAYYGYQIAQSIPDMHERLMSDEDFSEKVITNMNSLSSLTLVKNITNYTAIILGFVSWVGLYMLWRPSRLIFVASILVSYFISPIIGNIYTNELNKGILGEIMAQSNIPSFEPWSQIILVTMGLINGALLLIIYSNLSNHLFNNKHASQST